MQNEPAVQKNAHQSCKEKNNNQKQTFPNPYQGRTLINLG